MTFKEKLRASEESSQSLLCLGLDPEPDLMPIQIEGTPAGVASFVREIVDATADLVSSYKLNLAFFERWGREGNGLLDQSSSMPSAATWGARRRPMRTASCRRGGPTASP
jgi:hypothetical protein